MVNTGGGYGGVVQGGEHGEGEGYWMRHPLDIEREHDDRMLSEQGILTSGHRSSMIQADRSLSGYEMSTTNRHSMVEFATSESISCLSDTTYVNRVQNTSWDIHHHNKGVTNSQFSGQQNLITTLNNPTDVVLRNSLLPPSLCTLSTGSCHLPSAQEELLSISISSGNKTITPNILNPPSAPVTPMMPITNKPGSSTTTMVKHTSLCPNVIETDTSLTLMNSSSSSGSSSGISSGNVILSTNFTSNTTDLESIPLSLFSPLYQQYTDRLNHAPLNFYTNVLGTHVLLHKQELELLMSIFSTT